MKTQQKIIRAYYGLLSKVFPGMAGRQAFRLFQTTRKKPMTDAEKRFYNQAERYVICREKEDLIAYRIGNPKGKVVFLVHGWESNAGSMAAIAYALVQCGFNVITFDLPAHGHSRLKRTNLMECYRAFRDVLDYFRPERFSVISHSFGSAVTAFTLSHTVYIPEHVVFLTSPDRILDIFRYFANYIGLGNRAYQHFLGLIHNILKEPLEEVAVSRLMKKVPYQDLLLVHDVHDKIIPFDHSTRFHDQLERSSLIPFEKIGHYRMLWNTEVITSVLQHWYSEYQPEKTQVQVSEQR